MCHILKQFKSDPIIHVFNSNGKQRSQIKPMRGRGKYAKPASGPGSNHHPKLMTIVLIQTLYIIDDSEYYLLLTEAVALSANILMYISFYDSCTNGINIYKERIEKKKEKKS